jgi:eukaryotic-like serine/threonine-protein kinase
MDTGTTERRLAGRYRVLRPLGHGGMAVVELARDEELGRTVAIKLLADNLARDAAFRERFLREARIAARVAHPNVVRVYDVGEDDGRPYIVMEYVDGETLEELLQRDGRLEAARAVELATQLCAGLAAAHDAGLVHRDVKPQNLLVRRDGVLKIADFGVARLEAATRLTRTGTVLGTAAYLAPEQALGRDVTTAADVYAAGAVLYELLTGRPPREVATAADLSRALELPVVPLRELAPEAPRALEELVMRCLAHYPEHRPESAAALAAELTAAVPDARTLPLPARHLTRPTAVQERRRTSRRSRAVVAVVIASAVVGAVVALVAAQHGGSAPSPRPALPPAVRPVPHSADPAQEARNLSNWLRAASR